MTNFWIFQKGQNYSQTICESKGGQRKKPLRMCVLPEIQSTQMLVGTTLKDVCETLKKQCPAQRPTTSQNRRTMHTKDTDGSGFIEPNEFIRPLSRWVHDSKTAPRPLAAPRCDQRKTNPVWAPVYIAFCDIRHYGVIDCHIYICIYTSTICVYILYIRTIMYIYIYVQLCTHVDICIYIYKYMSIYTYIYIHVSIYVCVYICIYIYMLIYIHIYIQIYRYIYIYVYIYICVHICICIYVYIYIYIYMYLYIYIYIHI